MLAGQSSTVISWSAKHLEVVLVLWAGAKVLLENEISISIKLVSRWKHTVLQNLLVDDCIDFGLDKTQWTNTSRRLSRCTHEEDTRTRRRGGKIKITVFNGDIKAGQDKARLTWTETPGSNE